MDVTSETYLGILFYIAKKTSYMYKYWFCWCVIIWLNSCWKPCWSFKFGVIIIHCSKNQYGTSGICNKPKQTPTVGTTLHTRIQFLRDMYTTRCCICVWIPSRRWYYGTINVPFNCRIRMICRQYYTWFCGVFFVKTLILFVFILT